MHVVRDSQSLYFWLLFFSYFVHKIFLGEYHMPILKFLGEKTHFAKGKDGKANQPSQAGLKSLDHELRYS